MTIVRLLIALAAGIWLVQRNQQAKRAQELLEKVIGQLDLKLSTDRRERGKQKSKSVLA